MMPPLRRPLPPRPVPAPVAKPIPPAAVALDLLLVVHCEAGARGTTTHDGDPRIDWSRDLAGFSTVAAAWLDYGAKLRDVGARCSFMAPRSWWESVRVWQPTWAQEMRALGHECGLHERGGAGSYEAARAALAQVLGDEAPRIASGVLQSEVAGFERGWVFTGMSFSAGHAAGSNLAGQHLSGLWTFDSGDAWEGPGSRYTMIGYGSGSTSKADRMIRDLPRLDGIQKYEDDAPAGVAPYAIHGIMVDAQGLVSSRQALGISPDDSPEVILDILTRAMGTEGVRAATFGSLLKGWTGVPLCIRTAGREAGENHWQGIGGGTQR